MCRIAASFFILSAILISCKLQNPAPVLLKGEEFYGKRDLEYTGEYHLIRENIGFSTRGENGKASMDKIRRNNNKAQNAVGYKFVMPIKGTVISTTSSDKVCKDGIKIAAQGGTNVVASAPGKVIYVGKGLRWYGSLVIVEHKDNYLTVYSYLKNIHVEIGDKVKQGQVIGSAGKPNTRDRDPQMCFAILHNSQSVDPLRHVKYN